MALLGRAWETTMKLATIRASDLKPGQGFFRGNIPYVAQVVRMESGLGGFSLVVEASRVAPCRQGHLWKETLSYSSPFCQVVVWDDHA